MIWTAIVSIVSALLVPIFDALPTVAVPFGSSSTALAADIGGWAATVNSFLPINESLTIAYWLAATLLPAGAVYVVASWIWRHWPTIWGFGTGAG